MQIKWTVEKIQEIYEKPFLELVYEAATIHRKYHNSKEVQISALLSAKTGGCREDCSYCSQSSKHNTGLTPGKIYDIEIVLEAATNAKKAGATRFCIGAAQREVKNNSEFEFILDMVSQVSKLGLEVCCTLGMLTYEQAQKLADAGLHTYNHNIETSREYYGKVVTTHTFEDRLATLRNIRQANLHVCCGAIIGIGETKQDIIRMIHTLANLPKYPESVPINGLVPIKGTPLEDYPGTSVWEMARVIATVRITMPMATVRLSAGRSLMSATEQALCFLAGANSIFIGEKLLTTPAASINHDIQMLETLGLSMKKAKK